MGITQRFVYSKSALEFFDACIEQDSDYSVILRTFEAIIANRPSAGFIISKPPLTFRRLDVPPPLELIFDYEAERARIWADAFEPKPKKRRHKFRTLPPLHVDTRRDSD